MMTVYVVSTRTYGKVSEKVKREFKSIQPFAVCTTFAEAKKTGMRLLECFGAGLKPRYVTLTDEKDCTKVGGKGHWHMGASYWTTSDGKKVKDDSNICNVSIDSMPLDTDKQTAKLAKTKWYVDGEMYHNAFLELRHAVQLALEYAADGELREKLIKALRVAHYRITPNANFYVSVMGSDGKVRHINESPEMFAEILGKKPTDIKPVKSRTSRKGKRT